MPSEGAPNAPMLCHAVKQGTRRHQGFHIGPHPPKNVNLVFAQTPQEGPVEWRPIQWLLAGLVSNKGCLPKAPPAHFC